MGKGTWYKYAHRLGIKRKIFKIKNKAKVGLRASTPLQILHMDVTIFKPMDHTRVYIYFIIIDNFSRAILNWEVSLEYSSATAMKLLKGAVSKCKIDTTAKLITDGGPENQGEVTSYIDDTSFIEQLIAQKDIIQSNSMVEAVNKHVKYHYIFKKELQDFDETKALLTSTIPDYNNKPHGQLYGLTPNEVLQGDIPTKNNYRQDIIQSRKNRITQNQQASCCEE